MRHNRIKPDDRDTWHHCFNRISGTSLDLPFTDADKEQFIRILKRVSLLYTVKVVSFEVMSNHFHLLIQAPAESTTRLPMGRTLQGRSAFEFILQAVHAYFQNDPSPSLLPGVT